MNLRGDDRPLKIIPMADEKGRFWRTAVVIGTGIFVTGLGWPGLIGRLPFGLFLKNQLHLPPEKVSLFWAVGAAAWYLKPLFGLVSDAWPLFGSHRRNYLLLGALLATVGWAGFAVLPATYVALMSVMMALNMGLVITSAAVSGILVERGQRHGATGRLSALRTALEGAMSLVAGPLGSVLALHALAVTAMSGAAIVAALLPVTLLLFRERETAPSPAAPWTKAIGVFKPVVRSRSMWMTALLMFLVYLSPGLQTPLLYFQQDVLKFDVRFMGTLQFVGGLGALLGSAAYAWLCRRQPLRRLLIGGIILNAAAALLFLGYRSAHAALVIEALVGVTGSIGTLPLYDLTVRSTPRGSEGFGFSLIIGIRDVALYGLSDPLGSLIYSHFSHGFAKLVFANAGSTLAVLLLVPFLPTALLDAREGQHA